MAVTDTSDQARQAQLDAFAAMPGGGKVLLAMEMAEQSKSIALDGIRYRSPHLTKPELHLAWLELLHGDLAGQFGSYKTDSTAL